jgi:hypothetical protein
MTGKRSVRPSTRMAGWGIPIAAVAVLGGFLAGERVGSRPPATVAESPAASAAPSTGGPPDLASISPEERASRLYDRIMRYSEQGRLDSARFFAPMALQAYVALGRLDDHTHYDVGMIWAVVGDSARARSEAASILNEHPTHLLGLLLAMRSAATPAIRASFQRKLVAASKTELAIPLPEYLEHQHDIDGALSAAKLAGK